MHLFQVHSRHPDEIKRTWLVIALNEEEARTLVPSPFDVIEIVRVGDSASKTSDIVGWIGMPISRTSTEP